MNWEDWLKKQLTASTHRDLDRLEYLWTSELKKFLIVYPEKPQHCSYWQKTVFFSIYLSFWKASACLFLNCQRCQRSLRMLPDNGVAAKTNLWHMRWAHSIALILQLTSLHMKARGQIFMQLLSCFHVPYSFCCFKQVRHCNSHSSIFLQKTQKCKVLFIICSSAGFSSQLVRLKSSFILIFLFHSHWVLLQPGRGKHTFGDYLLTTWFHWNLFSVTAFRRRVGSSNKWAPAFLCE